jgi:hypothetical protein
MGEGNRNPRKHNQKQLETEFAGIIYSRLIADNNLPKIAFLAESFNLV